MKNKTKTALAATATAIGVATAALFGLNTIEEGVTPPIKVAENTKELLASEAIKYDFETETIETSVSVMNLDENTVEEGSTVSDFIQAENTKNADTTEYDPLVSYRTKVEKNGVIIYYYENVPLDLMPLLIQEKSSNALTLRSGASVSENDLAVVNNYIFVQTADGMLYLSQLSHGMVEDDRITENDFNGYMIYLNQSIECYDWLPFKNFVGSFYGNGNSIYVMTIAENVTLAIDNMLADNFCGRLEKLRIYCDSENTPLINNANGAVFYDIEFCGAVTYLIENSENTLIDNCAVFAYCNAVIKNANSVSIRNTVIENEMKTALIETAYDSCIIENNIIASIIQGEPESNCGAFVGTLKNEIVLKNNLSQCVIEVHIGYGGHAIGYVDYEYGETENISGNYFESSLTVAGEESDLFIGNIDRFKITGALNSLEKPFTFSDCAICYNVGGVATTVYNLGLLPDYVTLDNGGDKFNEENEEQLKSYNTKIAELKKLEAYAESSYEGFYEIIDLSAINQTAKVNGNMQIIEDGERYCFAKPETPDEPVITDITYSDGNVIIFFNNVIENKTAIVATFNENKLLTVSSTNITGGTVFVEVPHDENAKTVKIMIWDNLSGMTPICEAYEKELTK